MNKVEEQILLKTIKLLKESLNLAETLKLEDLQISILKCYLICQRSLTPEPSEIKDKISNFLENFDKDFKSFLQNKV